MPIQDAIELGVKGPQDLSQLDLERLCFLAVDLLCVCSFDGVFKALNPAWTRTLGWTREELTTKPFLEFVHPDDIARTVQVFEQLMGGWDLHPQQNFSNRYKHRSGEWVWLRWGCAVDLQRQLIYATAHDVTINRRLHERLESLVQTDPLTGLMSRRGANEALVRSTALARRSDFHFCILLIDVDHFKRVNDTRGHAEGDRVLTLVASTIRATVRDTDAICRWGGEEFMVLAPNSTLPTIMELGERIRIAIEREATVTVSVGVAEGAKGDTPFTVMERADMRLYTAKNDGRNLVR